MLIENANGIVIVLLPITVIKTVVAPRKLFQIPKLNCVMP